MSTDHSKNQTRNPGDRLTTNIVWALEFVWRSSPGWTLCSAALTLLQTALPLLGIYLIKLVVDAVAAGVAGATPAVTTREIAYLILLSGSVFFLERALVTVVEFVRTAQTHIATDRIYGILHAKAIEVDLEYYENSDYYDTLHRALQDAPYRPKRILDNFFTFVQSAISLVAICGLLLTFHWSVPAFLIVGALPGLLVRFRFAKKLFVWSRTRTLAERQALYFTSILTGESHPKEIRLFNLGRVFMDRFERLRNYIRHETLGLLKQRSVADLVTQSAAIIPVFALYGFLAYRALQRLISVGDLVMFYQVVQKGQTSLGQCLGSIAELYENNLFIANVHEFLALEPKVIDPPQPKTLPASLRDGIVFHDVRFRYPNSDRTVLHGINIRIRPGEHIALVGENGCGKTTLVKLLARLYDPTEGAITFDGIDLRDLSVGALRKKVSIIFQDYAKYPLSAKENIWVGSIEVPRGDERIISAARHAGAHETIAKLKDGYDTVLGRRFENGQELSIGEWQKVALARAFLREADILILDEPTSALDAKAEYETFQKLHQLFHGRTAILISHRLSTVRMADRIYFLEDGNIVENGSHDDLIDEGGKYAYMFEKQAQYYR